MNGLRIDTRDKKPSLWNVLILTIIVIVAIAGLFLLKGESGVVYFCAILLFYFLAVFVLLVAAFFKQLQYNPYSYNTIFYAGFSLFVLSIIITLVFLMVRMFKEPEGYRTFRQIAVLLSASGKNYMLLSAPFILIFSIALFVSNVSLIRHEGKRLVNLLGIILAVLMVGGELFLWRFDFYVSGSLWDIIIHEFASNLFAAIYLYFECMLIGAMIAMAIAARFDPPKNKDYLIILGCGIREDGSPSPILKGRIDRAIRFRNEQLKETGKDLLFVTSGGQGGDEVISESASMKKYLIGQGIPEERIIEEDKSTSTFENMQFSREKIIAHQGEREKGKVAAGELENEVGAGAALNTETNIAFSTTNYHVFRGGLYARRVKMRAQGMGAKTKWYFWPNASVREFVGLITGHKGKQAIIITCLIIIYVIMVLLVYTE